MTEVFNCPTNTKRSNQAAKSVLKSIDRLTS
ncbi:hypothetical protein CAEBREN_03227 [Caenorhabditis brenneri]|uniref:Uncharacterized protein n=1 Tax=Caenorhabditis brenneri TaxID=135651 RepID=G0NNU2_CAEBE|nr:hypothetical protein CAEBREN_03227 [Caenorhabditis brenneri]